MSYSIDLTRISLQTFQDILKRKNLLESRRILPNDLEANFQRIAGADWSPYLRFISLLSQDTMIPGKTRSGNTQDCVRQKKKAADRSGYISERMMNDHEEHI